MLSMLFDDIIRLMLNVLVTVGPVTIYSFGVFLFLGLVMGVFASWRRIEEYHIDEKEFFDVALEVLVWGLIFARGTYIASHWGDFGINLLRWLWLTQYVGLSFWGGLVGIVVGLVRINKQQGGDVYRWLDLSSLGLSFGLAWGKVGVFLNGGSQLWPYLPVIEAVALVSLFVWLLWLEQEYRTIEWYRAGKSSAQTGFLWYWWLGWLGLISLVAEWGKMQVSLWGPVSVGVAISLVVMLVGIVGTYHRSGRNLGQDVGEFRKKLGLDKKRRSVVH